MKDIISDTDLAERPLGSPWLSLNIEIVKGTIGLIHRDIQQLFYL